MFLLKLLLGGALLAPVLLGALWVLASTGKLSVPKVCRQGPFSCSLFSSHATSPEANCSAVFFSAPVALLSLPMPLMLLFMPSSQ